MSMLLSLVSNTPLSLPNLLVLLFSLSGMVWGYVLALIAPEELFHGRKYFLLVRKIILGLVLVLVDYYFYLDEKYYLLIIFTGLLISLFLIEDVYFSKKKIYGLTYGSVYYLLFIVSFILISEKNFRLLFASTIFIYGLINGTLLKRVEES